MSHLFHVLVQMQIANLQMITADPPPQTLKMHWPILAPCPLRVWILGPLLPHLHWIRLRPSRFALVILHWSSPHSSLHHQTIGMSDAVFNSATCNCSQSLFGVCFFCLLEIQFYLFLFSTLFSTLLVVRGVDKYRAQTLVFTKV